MLDILRMTQFCMLNDPLTWFFLTEVFTRKDEYSEWKQLRTHRVTTFYHALQDLNPALPLLDVEYSFITDYPKARRFRQLIIDNDTVLKTKLFTDSFFVAPTEWPEWLKDSIDSDVTPKQLLNHLLNRQHVTFRMPNPYTLTLALFGFTFEEIAYVFNVSTDEVLERCYLGIKELKSNFAFLCWWHRIDINQLPPNLNSKYSFPQLLLKRAQFYNRFEELPATSFHTIFAEEVVNVDGSVLAGYPKDAQRVQNGLDYFPERKK